MRAMMIHILFFQALDNETCLITFSSTLFFVLVLLRMLSFIYHRYSLFLGYVWYTEWGLRQEL